MSAQLERDEAFWKLIGALENAGVLHHVKSNGVKATSAIEKMMANLSTIPHIAAIKTPSASIRNRQNRQAQNTL